MSQNLLVERLKFAKRELTALKTAHRRGLGNLKVYKKKITPPSSGHDSGFWYLIVTVDFDRRFSSYPFTYSLSTREINGNQSIEPVSFNYINNGFSARYGAIYLYSASRDNSFTIISTAPIISTAYTWIQP